MALYTTPDEFEIEYATNYSGSYSDDIMSGSVFISGTLGRSREGSHSSGSNWIYAAAAASRVIPTSQYYEHARKYNIGLNYKFSFGTCSSEIFADCVLPDAFQITALNGGTSVAGKVEINGGIFLPAPTGQAKVILGYPDIYVSASAGTIQISDNTWLQTFPFQQRYNSIPRRPGVQMFSRRISYTEDKTGGAPNWDVIYNAGVVNDDSSSPAQVTLEYLSKANYAAIDSDLAGIQHQTLTEFRAVITPVTLVMAATSSYWFPAPELFQKHFFGIGDGFRGQPQFARVSGSADSGAVGAYQHGQGILLRGWKYGVYNALPTLSRGVWRRGKFGQFRDMLEQRPVTKYFDNIGLKLDGNLGGVIGLTPSVVTVKFISGSNSYATASLSASLNTRETGIYDFQYRSNKPFFDNN